LTFKDLLISFTVEGFFNYRGCSFEVGGAVFFIY